MRIITYITLLAVLNGCSFSLPKFKIPRVHKITVQQGNVITQKMIDRLKPGMTREQVVFVMGEPVMRNTFNNTRWDYIYTAEVGDTFQDDSRVSIFFENDQLAYFTGDFAPTSETEDVEVASESEPDEPPSDPS